MDEPKTYRISADEVASRLARNITDHFHGTLHEGAMAAVRQPNQQPKFDPEHPFALRVRHTGEHTDPEAGWSVPQFRFKTLLGAARCAADLRKLDGRLEAQAFKMSPAEGKR